MRKLPDNKYLFRGTWYPFDKIRQIACSVAYLHPDNIEDEEDLDILIDAIVKGVPNVATEFIVALNEGASR